MNRLVSVGDDFTLPEEVNVADENLPVRLQNAALNATYLDKASGLTKTEAGTTYALTQRPSTIGAGTALAHPYTTARQTYNLAPKHLRKARAALAAAKAGLGRFKWLVVGDSNTRGLGADKALTSYPAQIQKMLNADPGLVLINADNRWKLTNFNLQAATRFTYYNSTASGKAVFTSDTPGTVVEYYYYGSTSAHTLSIDGGAPIAIPASATTDIKKYTVTGLPDTNHVVTITAAAAWTYFFGVAVHNGKGIGVTNAGISGSTSSDWQAAENDAPQKVTAAWAPNLTTINLGTNDAGTAIPVATYEANLTALVTLYKTTGDVVLCVPIPRGTAPTDITTYIEAVYRVADALDVPVVDLSDRWGSYAISNALGFYSDGLHGNPTSFSDLASGLTDGLAITPASATVRKLANPAVGVADPVYVWAAKNVPGDAGGGAPAIPEPENSMFATTGGPVIQDTNGKRWLDLGVDASTVLDARKTFDTAAAFTLAAVIRFETAPAATLQAFSVRGTHGSISITASGKFSAYGGGAAQTATPLAVSTGTWHRVIAVINGASSSITVDGVTTTGSTDVVTNPATTAKIAGSSANGTKLAAASLINRAVTAAEIAAIDAALSALTPA